jgi:Uma2 family endonuclease
MSTTRHKPATTFRRIGPRSAGMPMTAAEFDTTPGSVWDDRYRYELLNGVLVVSPYPRIGERDPNEFLGHLLWSYQESHPQGATLDLTVHEQTVPFGEQRRRADRALWCGLGRTPDPDRDTPTVLVEFVSGSRRDVLRDYEQKRDEYLAGGVVEYWVIDRFRRLMTVYRKGPIGPSYQIVTESQTYETDLLPGFVLPLARLLGRADLWKKTRPKRTRKPSAGESDG